MLNTFRRDERGATLVYVAMFLMLLLGVVGLSFDLGRHYVLSSELQKAADAAALAGAYQLDPDDAQATVLTRVNNAVAGSPVTENVRKLGEMSGGIVQMQVRALNSIPADDDTPIAAGNVGPPYQFVEVTTEAVVSNNIFARVVGQPANITVQRTAVARKGRAVCQVTPLAVCNPEETAANPGASVNPSDYYGRQILVRQVGGGGAQWTPGNFGFLDVPTAGNGAKALAEILASGAAPVCFNDDGVDTNPGQNNSVRNGLNTRFDIYENPFFNGNAKNNPLFAPAENVIKGYDTTGNTNQYCNNPDPVDPAAHPNIKALPRDTDLSESVRFGNGNWLCADYWQTVHPGVTEPAGCGTNVAVSTSAITRFEVYRYEIDNGLLPTGSGGNGPNATEKGAPVCSGSTPISPQNGDLSTDRRIITMAVLNCIQHDIRGNTEDVPVEVYFNGFLSETVNDSPADPQRGDIVLEVVGASVQGNGGLAPVRSRDWVELVR